MDKISVIIPVYNVEKFLRECLDSVINQSYKDLEIILIDDGSQDKSGAICDEYALKDQRIKVFHKENGGLSSARNYGLDNMSGDFFTFVDSDDVISNCFIQTLYANLISSGASVSVCAYKTFSDNLKESDAILDKKVEILSGSEALFKILSGSINFTVAWGKLYKTENFGALRFPVGKNNEDEFYVNEICLAEKWVFTSEELYYYRFNQNGIINGKFNLSKLVAIEALENRKDFLIKNGFLEYLDLNDKNLLYKIIFLYFECKKAGYKKQLKDLKRKYKEYYNSKNTSFNKKDKFRLRLFKICPWAYRVITETNRRIKCRKK